METIDDLRTRMAGNYGVSVNVLDAWLESQDNKHRNIKLVLKIATAHPDVMKGLKNYITPNTDIKNVFLLECINQKEAFARIAIVCAVEVEVVKKWWSNFSAMPYDSFLLLILWIISTDARRIIKENIPEDKQQYFKYKALYS